MKDQLPVLAPAVLPAPATDNRPARASIPRWRQLTVLATAAAALAACAENGDTPVPVPVGGQGGGVEVGSNNSTVEEFQDLAQPECGPASIQPLANGGLEITFGVANPEDMEHTLLAVNYANVGQQADSSESSYFQNADEAIFDVPADVASEGEPNLMAFNLPDGIDVPNGEQNISPASAIVQAVMATGNVPPGDAIALGQAIEAHSAMCDPQLSLPPDEGGETQQTDTQNPDAENAAPPDEFVPYEGDLPQDTIDYYFNNNDGVVSAIITIENALTPGTDLYDQAKEERIGAALDDLEANGVQISQTDVRVVIYDSATEDPNGTEIPRDEWIDLA